MNQPQRSWKSYSVFAMWAAIAFLVIVVATRLMGRGGQPSEAEPPKPRDVASPSSGPLLTGRGNGPFELSPASSKSDTPEALAAFQQLLPSLCSNPDDLQVSSGLASAVSAAYADSDAVRAALAQFLQQALSEERFSCAELVVIIARSVPDRKLPRALLRAVAASNVPTRPRLPAPNSAQPRLLHFITSLRFYLLHIGGVAGAVEDARWLLASFPASEVLLLLAADILCSYGSEEDLTVVALVERVGASPFLSALVTTGLAGRTSSPSLSDLLRIYTSDKISAAELLFLFDRAMEVLPADWSVAIVGAEAVRQGNPRVSAEALMRSVADLHTTETGKQRIPELARALIRALPKTESSTQRRYLAAAFHPMRSVLGGDQDIELLRQYLWEPTPDGANPEEVVSRANLFSVIAKRADLAELLDWARRASASNDVGVLATVLRYFHSQRSKDARDLSYGDARATIARIIGEELPKAPHGGRASLLTAAIQVIAVWEMRELKAALEGFIADPRSTQWRESAKEVLAGL